MLHVLVHKFCMHPSHVFYWYSNTYELKTTYILIPIFNFCLEETNSNGANINKSIEVLSNHYELGIYYVTVQNRVCNFLYLCLVCLLCVIVVILVYIIMQPRESSRCSLNPNSDLLSPQFYKHHNSITSTLPRTSPDKMSSKIAPVDLIMPNFSNKMERHDKWFSDPFYTFEGGYKMCLEVDAAGYGDVSGNDDEKGTHLFISLHLMKGSYDDDLEKSGHWPMRGAFTVELLNQFYGVLHQRDVYFINNESCNVCTERVWGYSLAPGFRDIHFISHGRLTSQRFYRSYTNDGNLHFRVSYSPSYSYAFIWSVTMERSLVVLMTSFMDSAFTVIMSVIIEMIRSSKSPFDIKLLSVLAKWTILKDFFNTLLFMELVVLTEVPVVLLWECGVVYYLTYRSLLRTMHRLFYISVYSKVVRTYTLFDANKFTFFISLPWLMYIVQQFYNDIVLATLLTIGFLCDTLLVIYVMPYLLRDVQ